MSPRAVALLTLLAWARGGAEVAGGVSLFASDAACSGSAPEGCAENFHCIQCSASPDIGRDCGDGEDDATCETSGAYAVDSFRSPITWQVRAAPRLPLE